MYDYSLRRFDTIHQCDILKNEQTDTFAIRYLPSMVIQKQNKYSNAQLLVNVLFF